MIYYMTKSNTSEKSPMANHGAFPCDEQNNSRLYDTSSVDFAVVLQNGCHNVDFRSIFL